MKFCHYILVILILAILLSTSAFAADNVTFNTLPNGMKVIVREGHSINLAAMEIWVKAGSINETQENNGVSHFVEHMIFKATQKYGPGQIDREIEGLGAELNGGTSKDWVHFFTTVDSEYLPTALGALADAIMNAQFRQEDMDKERSVILDEIARGESDPSRRAFNLFARTAFTSHPYMLTPAGTRESVNKLTREDMVAYYNKYYTPANTCVVITGDVVTADAIKLVQSTFAGFQRTSLSTEPKLEPAPTVPRTQRYVSSYDQTYVVMGYQGPSISEFKDVCALDVILSVLGDTNKGRLARDLITNKIKFSKIATDFIAQRHPSTFSIQIVVDPADKDKAISILQSEFDRLTKEALSIDELSQAKSLVEGGDMYEQETFSGQARILGLYESIGTYNLGLKYAGTVRAITAQDVLSAAQKYFGDGNYCLMLIEPKSVGN